MLKGRQRSCTVSVPSVVITVLLHPSIHPTIYCITASPALRPGGVLELLQLRWGEGRMRPGRGITSS